MQGCEVGTKLRYWLTLVSGMLECLCFAGMVFGYASLVFVLKKERYFSELCTSNTSSNSTQTETVFLFLSDCISQDEQFSLAFTIASFLNNFLSLINGYLFDRFGTMVTRLLAISLYTTGTLLMAFSSAAYSLMIFPALCCIAVGGILLLLTNMQVGNLFAAHRSTIITLYNGAFDSSSAVFLIIKVLYEQGVSLQSCFFALSLCSIIHVVRTFLLMPTTRIPYPLPQRYTYGVNCGQADSYNVEELEMARDATMALPQGPSGKDATTRPDEPEAGNTEKVAGFWSHVLSWFFLWHLLWLSIMQLRHYLFIGTLNSRLSRLAKYDAVLGNICWYLNPRETEQDADLRSSYLSLFLTSLQCLLFSVCASIPVLTLQYLTFILQVLNRSFLYGGSAAFISIAFPACHFGKLFGLLMALSAVISLLQYPLFALVKGALQGDPFYVDITLTVLTALVFIHPAYVFIHCRRQARSREAAQKSSSITGPDLR
uniref:Solute carrier family 43 member 3a n=1 Tax=Fundulus heteroclitus TaxID=8078 RepID=A0A3Q2QNJ1_FUNHE